MGYFLIRDEFGYNFGVNLLDTHPGPGGDDQITAYEALEYRFWMQHGTWSPTDLGDGRTQETFIIAAVATQNRKEIHRAVNNLEVLFKAAGEYVNGDMPAEMNPVWAIEQTDQENRRRRALVYGGTVVKLDDEVLHRQLNKLVARFAVTFTRATIWEYSDLITKVHEVTNMHGGKFHIPTRLTKGTQFGRVASLYVGPKSGKIKKIWCGFKQSVHLSNHSFDPQIQTSAIRADETWLGTKLITADSRYHGSNGIRFRYRGTTDELTNDRSSWGVRCRIPLHRWNSTLSGTAAARLGWIGEYHLVMRYSTAAAESAVYGIQAYTGWRYPNIVDEVPTTEGLTPLKRVYVSSNNGAFNYVDLGIIRIGNKFNIMKHRTTTLKEFSIYISSALTVEDDSESEAFFMDDLFLIPADHSVYAELHGEIGGARAVDIYTDEKGDTFGYVLEHSGYNPEGQRTIVTDVPTVTPRNWSFPDRQKAFVVLLCDRDEGSTLPLTDSNAVLAYQVYPKVASYADISII